MLFFMRPKVAAAVPFEKSGVVAAGTLASGTDVFEATDTGVVAADTVLLGADAFTATETATVSIGSGTAVLPSGSLYPSTSLFPGAGGGGAVLAGFAILGAGTKAGVVAAGTKVVGTDVFTATEAGSVRTAALLAGVGSLSAIAKAGTVAAYTWASAGDVFTASETGKVLTAARFSGFFRPAPGPGGKFVLTNAYVTIAGVDVSRFCTQVEVVMEREPIEITPFGSIYKVYMDGPATGQFTIDMFADPTILTPAFWTLLNSPVAVEVHPRGAVATETNPAWTATATAVKRVPLKGQVGDAATAMIELRATTEILETV